MKSIFLILIIISLAPSVKAQDVSVKQLQKEAGRTIKKDTKDTTDWRWKKGGRVSVNLTQGSLKNWAAGGDNFSLALNSNLNYFILYKKGKNTWDNTLDFNFGMVQTTSLGTRKNDDRIDILSKYGRRLNEKWSYGGLVNFRTQFFDGYTYSGTQSNFSSTIFSPAYAIASVGFDYKPSDNLSIFISPVTGRWIIVGDSFLSAKGLYGVKPGMRVATEFGAFSTIQYKKDFTDNISYKGRVDLFSNYLSKPQDVDVFMTNFLAFKINKYLSATYSLDLIYDDDTKLFGANNNSPGMQIKSLIGIGFLMPIK